MSALVCHFFKNVLYQYLIALSYVLVPTTCVSTTHYYRFTYPTLAIVFFIATPLHTTSFFLKTKYAFIEIESPFKCLTLSSLFENTYWFLTYRTANLGSNESNRIGFIANDVLNASNRLDNNDNTIT